MNRDIEMLYARLGKRGYQGRVVSIHHLQDLHQDIEGRFAQGAFDQDFYRERLTFFEFEPPEDLAAALSIIVVAVPRPQHRVVFHSNGKELALIIPPTYVGYTEISRQVAGLIAEWLAPEGYRVASTMLPLKTLATRSGLSEYGRNNISYVPGMGSFYQLVAVYSDLPCLEDEWGDPRMLARCQTCKACMKQCPTEAISSERFLLHAERCIVFHNEKPGEIRFPSWIEPAAHNCLIGCMLCQKYCPEDKVFLDWVEDAEEFSDQETSLLLRGVTPDQLPKVTTEKLEHLELLDALDQMPRKLGIFLRKE